jgi:hypothetical protein
MVARDLSLRVVLLDSASTNTSGPVFVGDMRLLTVSFSSIGSLGASRFTLQGSNADGLRTADLGASTSDTNWSFISGVNMVGVTPGMVLLDPPGYRWLRAHVTPFVDSTLSYTTLILNGRGW